jgi:hypothetical protein
MCKGKWRFLHDWNQWDAASSEGNCRNALDSGGR